MFHGLTSTHVQNEVTGTVLLVYCRLFHVAANQCVVFARRNKGINLPLIEFVA